MTEQLREKEVANPQTNSQVSKTSEVPTPNKKARPRLTVEQYERAKLMRQQDSATVRVIAEEMGVTQDAITKRFTKDKIKKGSHVHIRNAAIAKARLEAAAQQAADMCESSTRTSAISVKGCEVIAKATAKIVIDALRENKPVGLYADDLKALGQAGKNLETAHTVAKKILDQYGIEDDDVLPELVIRTMTPEDVERLRDEQAAELEMEMGGTLESLGDQLDVDAAVTKALEAPSEAT